MDEEQFERRVRERAHRIWEDEGQPSGKADQHWDLARFAIAQEDAQQSMLKPVSINDSEPIEALLNQGEFPTLTDQGEQQAPNPHHAVDSPANN
jgi:hypothetical protein